MPKVIDGKGHVFGRLASVVAKQLLQGEKLVVVRCEQIVLSGSFFRQKLRWRSALRKRMNTNPRRGPFHFRSPSRSFFRAVRGMIKHKTQRGDDALANLKVFEGVPDNYQNTKYWKVRHAHSVNRFATCRKSCTLGRLCHEHGWGYREVVNKMEDGRKAAEQFKYVERKKRDAKAAAAKKQLKESATGEMKKMIEFVEQHTCDF